jgi:plastocyanin
MNGHEAVTGREVAPATERRRRQRIPAWLLAAVVLLFLAPACGASGGTAKPLAANTVDVTVLDNSFNPEVLVITPGTTVRWTNKGKLDHNSIVATGDLKFGVEAKDFGPGKSHSFTFDKVGEYSYYCALHGTAERGMTGKIIVTNDKGSVGTTPGTQPTDMNAVGGTGVVLKVPGQFPTIQGAVDAAHAGDMVLVGKGTYHEAVKVTKDNIVIRGEDRNETVLDGEFKLDNGFLVSGANGVTIENMTAKNYKVNGFFWTGVKGYRGSYLTAIRNGDYGLYGFDSRYGQFDHSLGTGSPDAGFYIGQCYPCDALITDSESYLNGLGYSGTNAGGNLRIVRSTFRDNRAGIVPNSGSYEKYPPERESTIVGNIVHGNFRDDVPAINAALLVEGSGIISAGGIDNVIERNLVYDHDKAGILLLGFPDGDTVWDVTGNKVRENDVSNSRVADLALVTKDQNQGNCFSGNVFKTSAPKNIEKLAPCTGTGVGDISDGNLGLAGFITNQNPPSVDYKTMPDPPAQPTMPDAMTAPWKPAAPGNLPTIQVDVAAIPLPTRPS